MSAYYLRLKEQDTLPVRWIEDDLGLEVRHVAYALGLLRSAGASDAMPQALDRLLCDLNRHVCRIDAAGLATWRNGKGTRLCVPAVAWTNALHVARLRDYGKHSIEWIERTYGSCSAVGAKDCAALLEQVALRRNAEGWVDVPVLAQGAVRMEGSPVTSCEVAPDTGELSKQLTPDGAVYLRVKQKISEPISATLDLAARKALAAQAHGVDISWTSGTSMMVGRINEAVESLAVTTAIDAGESIAFAAPARVGTEDARSVAPTEAGTVLNLSSYERIEEKTMAAAAEPAQAVPPAQMLRPPFVNEALLDIELSSAGAAAVETRADVLVLDFPSNVCHPVIRHAVRSAQCPNETAPPAEYSLLVNPRPQKKHHGTHVSALVAGALGIGVHPNARLHVDSIIPPDGVDRTEFDYDLEQIVSAKVLWRPAAVRVVNLSVDFNLPRSSELYAKLETSIDHADNVLFVAAAGDDSASLDGVCEVVPACLRAQRRSNLMVVGGAKKSCGEWHIHERSRYGKRVDILAPADNVLSAAEDSGALVRLSGTSQATAIVSGVAAHLFDHPAPQNSSWSPAQIKHRLKATATLYPALAGATSSGVLSADRALNTADQVVRYLEDGVERHVRGQIIDVLDDRGNRTDGFFPIAAASLPESLASFCRMYRFHKDARGLVTFFYEPASLHAQTRWTLMEIHADARVLTTNKVLVFEPRDRPLERIQIAIASITDFVDKFSGERACTGAQ